MPFFDGKNQGALLDSLSLVKGAMESLKMLTTDAERKDVWQMLSMYFWSCWGHMT